MHAHDVPSPGALTAQAHVVVVGGGIAGMVAALECAKIGMRVTLLEASTALGGTIHAAEIAGHVIDVGAQGFSVRGEAVLELVAELGLGADVCSPAAGTAWVAGLPGGAAAPLPAGGVLGIPGNPFVTDVTRVIGTRGSWRAYLDRVRPVLTIGREHSLGALVRSRMGARVLDRLVAPVTRGTFGVAPDEIDVEIAAPGLNGALTRTGSLSGAVLQLQGDDAGAGVSSLRGIRGGMHRLVAALDARLRELGVEVRTGTEVIALRAGTAPDPEDRFAPAPRAWQLELLEAAEEADAGVGDAADSLGIETDARVSLGPRGSLEPEPLPPLGADFVIVAAPESVARRLLALPATATATDAALADAGTAAAGSAAEFAVEVVTLVLDAPGLPAARGPEVFTVAGSSRAAALIDETARWPELAGEAAADGRRRHVVRVLFGVADEPPATAGLDLAGATAMAVAEASALLGVPLSANHVLGSHRARFAQAPPAATIGHAQRTAALRRSIAARPGVVAVGAWLAGSGIAQVIPDATAQAEIIRQAALWGASTAQ